MQGPTDRLVIQSYASFMGQHSVNEIFLFKIKNLTHDVAKNIDEFLGGFAWFKLVHGSSVPKDFQLDLMKLLQRNMRNRGSTGARIDKTLLMLMFGKETLQMDPNIGYWMTVPKKSSVPISDELFEICQTFALVEYHNSIRRDDRELYGNILSGYLSFAIKTKVHVSVIMEW